ncbi:hypothetical protein FRC12_019698, partial [Ceratobasidium sp. 428]
MSHPLTWPSIPTFYPVSASPATSLTQDLSPEQSADILLLGCGDPGHILYTLSTDVTSPPVPRKLDITCCDLEPAVLARNLILFTLLDDDLSASTIWDIFYHFKLSEHVVGVLSTHARKLVKLSESSKTWNESKYGQFLKFVDGSSLSDIRRYWTSYAEFQNISSIRLAKLITEQGALSNLAKELLNSRRNIGASRSASVVWNEALQPVSEQYGQYWQNGTTATTNKDINKTALLNATFCYSQAYGETFIGVPNITFPQGFHFAPAFVPIEFDPVGSNVTSAMAKAKQQFKAACLALQASRKANALTLRFFVGDALALCKALNLYARSGEPRTQMFTAPWRAAPVDLTEHATSGPKAPLSFDIIDTSMLARSLGIVNLLLVTQPLLKKRAPSQAVLYMSLVFKEDPPDENLLRRLCNEIPTMGLLIGLVPRAYVSRFTSQSNTHDLQIEGNTRFNERVAWVDPTGGDKHAYEEPGPTLCVESWNMSKLMSGVYRQMFFWDCSSTLGVSNFTRYQLLLSSSADYDRETIAALWVHAQSRLQILDGNWESAVVGFLAVMDIGEENALSMSSFLETKMQHRLRGLRMRHHEHRPWENVPRIGVFKTWPDVPRTVCVVLKVPKEKLEPLRRDKEELGPRLICSIKDPSKAGKLSTYSSLHAVWGTCVSLNDSGDRYAIEEDLDGFRGQSDLVISFWIDSDELAFSNLKLNLAIRFTPLAYTAYYRELGEELNLFSTNIEDNDRVLVLRERPMGLGRTQEISSFLAPPATTNSDGIKHRLLILEDGMMFPCRSIVAHIDI